MTDTRALLNRITAFKQRLESMPRLLPDKALVRNDPPMPPVAEMAPDKSPELPARIGERARQGLHDAQRLVAELRELTDHPFVNNTVPVAEREVLETHLRETAALVHGAVRMIRFLPEGIPEQWTWCESLEATARAARHRIAVLKGNLGRLQSERNLMEAVAAQLRDVEEGRDCDPERLDRLAEIILEEPASGPLTWLEVGTEDPAIFFARHAVLVGRVLRRIAVGEEFLTNLLKAALVCDVAMLRLPAKLRSQTNLDLAERRLVESHCGRGAEAIRRAFPDGDLLAAIAAAHHERGDGTGYPNGWKREQIRPEARYLAIADVYAAMLEDRPWRPGAEPRTALTDILLLAERGLFEAALATKLLNIGFHPVGSVVELADGCLAAVLAGPRAGGPPNRPVVGLLTDSEGRPHPSAIPLDLSDAVGMSIVRTLTKAERRAKLGAAHLPWAV